VRDGTTKREGIDFTPHTVIGLSKEENKVPVIKELWRFKELWRYNEEPREVDYEIVDSLWESSG